MENNKVNLLFISYGTTENHSLTCLAILDFLYKTDGLGFNQIIVYTDSPDSFSVFQKKIEVIRIDKDFISKGRGKYDFVHRLKLVIIKEVLRNFKESMIYFDSDIIFKDNIIQLLNMVNSIETSIMCNREYEIKRHWKSQGKKFNKLLNTPLLKKYNKIESPLMYNAGVIGIHYDNMNLIDDCLNLCDEILEKLQLHTVEQFSVSIILQNYSRIIEAEEYVHHYWDIKPVYLAAAGDLFAPLKRPADLVDCTPIQTGFDSEDNGIDVLLKKYAGKPLPFYVRIRPNRIIRIKNNLIRFFKKHILKIKADQYYQEKIRYRKID